MNKLLLLITVFCMGYVLNDITDSELTFVPKVNADVGGMGYDALRQDRDFKQAVLYVVSRNCRVPDGYLHCKN